MDVVSTHARVVSTHACPSTLPIPIDAKMQCCYDGDERDANGKLFCEEKKTGDKSKDFAHWSRCNMAYYKRHASTTAKQAWDGLHGLYDKADVEAHHALDFMEVHKSKLKWAFVLVIVLIGIYALWSKYHGKVKEGHKGKKSRNSNKHSNHRVNKYWKGIYSKGLEMIVDGSVLQVDDGHGHKYDVNGHSANELADDVARYLNSAADVNWQSVALKIRTKNGGWKTYDVTRDVAQDFQEPNDDSDEVDGDEPEAPRRQRKHKARDEWVEENGVRVIGAMPIQASIQAEAKHVDVKESKEAKEPVVAVKTVKPKAPCHLHYLYKKCHKKNCAYSHAYSDIEGLAMIAKQKCPKGNACKSADCPFLCPKKFVKPEMANGRFKLRLEAPQAVTGIAQVDNSEDGMTYWSNTSFVGQDFLVPFHWYEKAKGQPGAEIRIAGKILKLTDCSLRRVAEDLVAVRPKSGAFVPARKAITRDPENEEVYLVAYDARDATTLSVSQGRCTVSSGGAVTYTASSQEGDCGGGVWAVKDNSVHLVGFHIFGAPSGNGFVPISKNLMDILNGAEVFRPSLA